MAIYQWTDGDGNGAFGDQYNWLNPNGPPYYGVPGAADIAVVTGSAVAISGSGTVAELVLASDGGLETDLLDLTTEALVLDGTVLLAASMLTATQEVQVAGGATTIAGGTVLKVDETQNPAATAATVGLDIGAQSGDTATLALTGLGSSVLVAAANTVVGDAGTGTLTIGAYTRLVTQDPGDSGSGDLILGNAAGGSGTLTVSASGLLQAGGEIIVGEQGTGRLTIASGAQASISLGQYRPDALVVGDKSGSNGAVLVTGAGSLLSVTDNAYSVIGNAGTGSVTVADGAQVQLRSVEVGFNGGKGSITVSGAGSLLGVDGFYLGASGGSGTLSVTSGAEVLLPEAGFLTMGESGSSAAVSVSGADSTLNTSGAGIDVGEGGSGKLTIGTGGTVISSSSYADDDIGVQSGSTGAVTINGSGASWAAANAFYVGLFGTGSLLIGAGGALITGDGTHGFVVGYEASGVGTAEVTGAGSHLTNSGEFIIGESGTGTLTVLAGGSVSTTLPSGAASDGADIGAVAGGSGKVTVSGAGSSFSVGGLLVVGAAGTGSLIIGTAGSVTAGTLQTSRFAAATITLSGTGTALQVSGDAQFGYVAATSVSIGTGSLLAIGGQATVGDATITVAGGKLTVGGVLYLNAGPGGTASLLVEAGGAVITATGSAGFIEGNNANATGTAEVTGAGSRLTNSGSFIIGDVGAGTLSVLAGGVVSTTTPSGSNLTGAVIGVLAGSSGKVTVSGAGSTWSIGSNLLVGFQGTASLVISSGGQVLAAALQTAQDAAAAASTISLSGAGTALQVSGSATFGLVEGKAATGVSIGAGSLLAIAGSAIIEDGKFTMAGGTFAVGKTLTLDAGQTITGSGTLQAASLINAGTVAASAGTLSFIGGITGTGTLDIGSASGSNLSLSAGVAAGQTVIFKAAAGTLSLGTPAQFLAEIEGFVKGDIIDLTGILTKNLTFSGHTLNVHETSGASLGLLFAGTYSTASFALPASDGHGGTLITHA